MNLLLTSVLLGAMVVPVESEREMPVPRFKPNPEKALLIGGAMVMPAEIEMEAPKPAPLPEPPPVPALPPEVLRMKDYLIARSFYKAQVSVQYTEEDHNKYVAQLDAASARDIKNWHFVSTVRSQQAARGHALSQQATMMRIQQIRAQEARNRLPYKRAATHQPFRPSPIRNGGFPYQQPSRFHYWVIIR